MRRACSNLLVGILALAGLAACRGAPTAPLGAIAHLEPAAAQVPTGMVQVVIRWPARDYPGFRAQAIPPSTNQLGIVIFDGSGHPISTTYVPRPAGADPVTSTPIRIPAGSGYTANVTAYRDTANPPAATSAAADGTIVAPFDVTINQTTTVNVTLSPLYVPQLSGVMATVGSTLQQVTNGGPGLFITLTGKGLNAGGLTKPLPTVTLGGLACTVFSASDTQCFALIPMGATNGTFTLAIDGQSTTLSTPFQVLQTISLTPTSYSTTAGVPVTLAATASDVQGVAVTNPTVQVTADASLSAMVNGFAVTPTHAGAGSIGLISGYLQARASITVSPGPVSVAGSTVSFTASPSVNTSAPFAIQLADQYGNLRPGVPYTVAANNGTVSPTSGTTDSAASGTGTFTAGTVTGTALVTVTAQGVNIEGSSPILPGPVSPTQSSIAIDYFDVGTVPWAHATLTITLRDGYGNPIPNNFVKGSSTLAGVSFVPSVAYSNSLGEAILYASSKAAGSTTLTATDISVSPAVTLAGSIAMNFDPYVDGHDAIDTLGNLYTSELLANQVDALQGALGVKAVLSFSPAIPAPRGIALDRAGSIYVADPSAGTIVKLTGTPPSMTETTYASGLTDPEYLACDPYGTLLVSCPSANEIVKVGPGGAPSSVFATPPDPAGLAFDQNGLLFTGSNNGTSWHLLRVVSNGAFSQYGPNITGTCGDVAVDVASNSVYVAASDGTIHRILTNQSDEPFASGLSSPTSLSLSLDGYSLYVGEDGGGGQVLLFGGVGGDTAVPETYTSATFRDPRF